MSSMHYLKQFDKAQLWRFFVDGRFHKKYRGWLGYEEGESGSVQALLNGFAFMLDHFDLSKGLCSTYLLDLHKICMLNVETSNLKSSPGDLRYLNAGMPFFAKSTTKENLRQILDERRGDDTLIFNTKKYAKTADAFELDELYEGLLKDQRINYRNWYPNIDKRTQDSLEKKNGLQAFYHAKHAVQMLFAEKMDEIVDRFNRTIKVAKNKEEQIDCFVLLIRHLELLHPFPDGNCRTFACITLTHLLLYYGFMPTLLYNPNFDGELSTEEFKQEIYDGMKLMEELLEDPKAPVYDYSIDQMPKEDQKQFLRMAKEVIKKIDTWREVYLTPQRIADLCSGSWYHEDASIRFKRVGDYNTYLADSLYFFMSLKEWEEEGRNIEEELRRLSEKGVLAIVTDDERVISWTSMPVLLVENVQKVYEETAMAVRQKVNPMTLLITGTEGKTGAKTQLYQLLSTQTSVHANINSANTAIPVLRSLINLAEDDKVELNEVSVGSNEALRVERTMWVNPDLCLFTHIGPNHMDMHKTMENLIWAKSSVVVGMREGGVCIVNSDMEYFEPLKEAIQKRRPGVKIVTFGNKESDDAQLKEAVFDEDRNGWNVTARVVDTELTYFVPMIQSHMPLASVGILLSVEKMGFDTRSVAANYDSIKPYETMGALRVLHKTQGDVLFYDQSRRGGINGMRSAFEDLSRLKKRGKIVALVGGISIKKDSDWTREAHHQLAELINESNIDELYTTGAYMEYVHEKLHTPQLMHSDDLNLLAKTLFHTVKPGDTLFIIGSAYLYLGRVADRILRACKHDLYDWHKPLKVPTLSLFRKELLKRKDQNVLTYQTEILLHFFDNLKEMMLREYGFKSVDGLLCENDQKHVYNASHCQSWFFNNTEMKQKKGYQLFGTFFDIGSDAFLLHVHLGTYNLHIGLVSYKTIQGSMSLLQMSDDARQSLVEKFSMLAPRKWWLGWCSIDCGQVVDLDEDEAFLLLNQFKESECYSQHMLPFIDAVKKSV